MFKCGYNDLLEPNYLFPGDYVVEGCYNVSIGTSVTDYLFDSAAETALAASDFVVLIQSGSTTGIRGVDSQGDAGSGTQNTVDGSYPVGDAPINMFRGETLVLPSSFFKAGQSTRTGTAIASAAATGLVFIFCSYPSAPASDQYYPGGYTINGHYLIEDVTNTEANYLFDSTAEGYLASSDFVMINAESNASTGRCVIFDTQGDGGSGALSLGDTSNSGGAVVWRVSANNSLTLPASIFSANSTRTGRMVGQGATTDRGVVFTFCSWL